MKSWREIDQTNILEQQLRETGVAMEAETLWKADAVQMKQKAWVREMVPGQSGLPSKNTLCLLEFFG